MHPDNDSGSEDERRREPRVSARVEVRFRESSQAARALRAYSLNFSVGGLCLRTKREYSIGEPLQLDVSVEGRDLTISGEVAWVRGGAIGVRFTQLRPEDRQALEALVATLNTA